MEIATKAVFSLIFSELAEFPHKFVLFSWKKDEA